MAKEKKIKTLRASICPACGIVKPRKTGEKATLCKCGSQMKKGKLAESVIKKGRVTIEELGTTESHPKHPSRRTRIDKLMAPDISSALRLSNFRNYIYDTRGESDLKGWWRIVFPKDKYPMDKPWMLIQFRLQYQLEAEKLAESGIIPACKFLVNYDAVMNMDTTKMSPILQNLILCYETANKKRALKRKEKAEREVDRIKVNETIEESEEEEEDV